MTEVEPVPVEPAADWRIYRASPEPHDDIGSLPAPPPWRRFDGGPPLSLDAAVAPMTHAAVVRARSYAADRETIDLVNTAMYLRRPLLVTGKPGTGKSTLAYSIAYELGLGPVLTWPVTSRSTLTEALYQYDALGRLEGGYAERQADQAPPIGRYLSMGPLGTALLPWERPRVLLIDELDKSDIDLPNNLLHVFEYGTYQIPELVRLPEEIDEVEVLTAEQQRVPIRRGQVTCRAFPIVVITSNGEREFPPPFLRRCVRVDIAPPSPETLDRIVASYFDPERTSEAHDLIREFVQLREHTDIATDQLLNAVYLTTGDAAAPPSVQGLVTAALLRDLNAGT